MARPRKRRIELGWFEAVVLMLGYMVSLVIVGVGGVYVGQRAVEQGAGAKKGRDQRLPVPGAGGAPAVQRPSSGEPDITFYETLGKKKSKPAGEGRLIIPEVPEGRSAEAARRPAAPKPAPAKQLAKPASPPERARGAAGITGTTGQEVPPPPAAPVRAEAPPLPSPPPGVTPEAAATARALLAIPPDAPPPAPTAKGTWSVQVNATQDAEMAERQAKQLRDRGYEAFVVTQVRDGMTWYRVRVGRLPNLEKANALVGELKTREGLPHAFVASD